MKSLKYRNKAKIYPPVRKVKDVILIVHEGKATEYNYFSGIKHEGRLSNLILKGPYSDPKTLILETIKSERPRKAGSLSVCEQPQGLPEGYSLIFPQSMSLTVMSASKAPFMIKTVLLRYVHMILHHMPFYYLRLSLRGQLMKYWP